MKKPTWKLLDLLNEASSFFCTKGVENSRLQAELLLAAVLEIKRLDLYLQYERVLLEHEVLMFREYVKSCLQGVPIQYITGVASFRLLDFKISDAVLIPRPETEVLVDCALEFVESVNDPHVLDLGCGSGAIAVSIAYENPSSLVTAIDIDLEALLVTRRNAENHGVLERMSFIRGDLLSSISLGNHFDLIICNPPYIPTLAIDKLDAGVRDFEPRRALDGGADGLDYYRQLTESAAVLCPGGALILEVGDGQVVDVVDIIEKSSRFAKIDVRVDLTNTPRIVIAYYPVVPMDITFDS